jgi:hypothetical protein
MTKVLRLLAVAWLLVGIASTANAAIINSALTNGLNTINDKNVDRFFTDLNGNSKIDVGDTLEAVLIFDNISNAVFGGTDLNVAVGIASYQLTAHIKNTIFSKTQIGGAGTPMDPTDDTFFFVMVPSIVNVYEDHAGLSGTILSGFAPQTAATTIASATDGVLVLTLSTAGTGLGGALDTWRAAGSDDFALLTTGNEANYLAAMSVAANPGGIPIVPDATTSGAFGAIPGTGDKHDVVATGEIEVASSAVLTAGWLAQSDTTISFQAVVVPEPTSFAIWAALGGLAMYYRRKK